MVPELAWGKFVFFCIVGLLNTLPLLSGLSFFEVPLDVVCFVDFSLSFLLLPSFDFDEAR